MAAVGFALSWILFRPLEEPRGWDVPPAHWVEEMQRRECESRRQQSYDEEQ